ncbi:hypothetical protein ACFWU5_26260 [Nocardia sp. NPDC058640]|uniref:hypothetical protein n=1 Tax=Nocardia sp. NPDC058640 TaxID=3346571 RepID=UPI00365B3AB6
MSDDGLFVVDGDWVRDVGPIGRGLTAIAAWLYQDIQGGLDSLIQVTDAIARSSRLSDVDFDLTGNAWFFSVDVNGVSVENNYIEDLESGLVSHDEALDVVRQYWEALINVGIEADLREALVRYEQQHGRKPEIAWIF